MPRKALMLMVVFFLLLSFLLNFPFHFEQPCKGQTNAIQQNNLQVRNLNTGKTYSRIQEAINAPETLDGHEIFVASGIYYEHVTVSKSLSLIGEDRNTTILDGNGNNKVVYVTAENVEVRNFTIQNGTTGLRLDNSHNSKIINNTFQGGSYGIRIYNSRNSQVAGNIIRGYSSFGVEIKASRNSTLRHNNMVENKYNFGVNGNSLSDFINDIDASNTVNGKPIHYLVNQHNMTIDDPTLQRIGYLGLVNSTNIKVKNLNVQNNKQGILFAFTRDSSISNVHAENNWNGFYIAHSSNISLTRNNASNNFDYGIKFFNSSRSMASRNNVDNNGCAGISLSKSHHSTVDGNEANFNAYNLHIVYTNNSIITRNNALNKSGGFSIAIYYSHNNVIYHNTFVNSLIYIETKNGTRLPPKNSWDNGIEGNYWSHYRDVDADQDGIGDTPYMVGEANVDNHPLMGEYYDFNVTLREEIYSVAIISNSNISQFSFSPEDEMVNLTTVGENETMNFWRIAVPNTLLQNLKGGNLSFLINDEQPPLKRKWADETHTYLYFSYVDSVSGSPISPWLVVAVASVLIVSVLVFLVLKTSRGGKRHELPENIALQKGMSICAITERSIRI